MTRREGQTLKSAAEEKSQLFHKEEKNDAVELSETPKFEKRRMKEQTLRKTSEKKTFHISSCCSRWRLEREEKKNVIKDISYKISSKKKKEQKNLNISEHPPTPGKFFFLIFFLRRFSVLK
jgi:GTPase SAR1 family protein